MTVPATDKSSPSSGKSTCKRNTDLRDRKPVPWSRKILYSVLGVPEKDYYYPHRHPALLRWIRSQRHDLVHDAVIVLGLQKAGTSVIATLLSEYGQLSRTIDVPDLWLPSLHELLEGKVSLEDIVRSNPGPFSAELVKEPNLTFFYDQLNKIWPSAKFVFIVRDPRDNLRSTLNYVGLPGDLAEVNVYESDIPATWPTYFEPDLWGAQTSHYVGVLAARWKAAARVYLDHPDEIELIRFEDFLENKVGAIGNLASELGIEKARDISDKVDIQYQPRGDRSVSWDEFFGPENLSRIENICAPELASFGYPSSTLED